MDTPIDVNETTSGSATASLSKLPKTYMTHVLYPIFPEKSIEKGLRYVRGLKVMLIDVNVNQAEYHKWVHHIFKNIHGTCFIFNFSREIDREWPRYIRGLPSHIFKNTHIVHVSCQFFKRNQLVMVRYVRGPPSHAHRRRQCQPGQVPQVGMTNYQKLTWHMF